MLFWIQNGSHRILVPIRFPCRRKDTEQQVSSVTSLVIEAGLNTTFIGRYVTLHGCRSNGFCGRCIMNVYIYVSYLVLLTGLPMDPFSTSNWATSGYHYYRRRHTKIWRQHTSHKNGADLRFRLHGRNNGQQQEDQYEPPSSRSSLEN